jgi:hypothetical protein
MVLARSLGPAGSVGSSLGGRAANRIPHFLRRLQGRRFSQWQAEVDAERDAHRGTSRVRSITSAPSLRRRDGRGTGTHAHAA